MTRMHWIDRAPVLSATRSRGWGWITPCRLRLGGAVGRAVGRVSVGRGRGRNLRSRGRIGVARGVVALPAGVGGGVDRLGDLGLLGDHVAGAAVAVRAGSGHDRDKTPPLRRRERPRLLDEDRVARMGVVLLVVGLELRRQADDQLVDRVAGEALDGHDDRLVHLVAHDAADLRLALGLLRCWLLRVLLPSSSYAVFLSLRRAGRSGSEIVRRVWGSSCSP
jgi:hypothetical protein